MFGLAELASLVNEPVHAFFDLTCADAEEQGAELRFVSFANAAHDNQINLARLVPYAPILNFQDRSGCIGYGDEFAATGNGRIDRDDEGTFRVGAEPERAASMVLGCLTSGHKLLVCGNGGSASDATHLATEFLCRFRDERRPYGAISLTANGEFMTAVCNDYMADEIFARQVWGLAAKGDLLIGFTTSGKSRNILRALEEANRQGIQSICFLGPRRWIYQGSGDPRCDGTGGIDGSHPGSA